MLRYLYLLAVCLPYASVVLAQDSDAELAKKLANPVASLISVPMQLNYDEKIGPGRDGKRSTLNIQPVVPFDIAPEWNLISRTILPLIDQKDIFPGAGSQSGVGDVTQSLFFSPKNTTSGGWIWGAGPVLLLPTGSDSLLTADKWGVGPTGVVLKQVGPWTYGALANHIWSVAGDADRADISATFVQPFVSYITSSKTTFAFTTETVHDWKRNQWTVPLNFTVSQLLRVGRLPLSVSAGVRYWAESPEVGPHGWGFRLQSTFLFPK